MGLTTILEVLSVKPTAELRPLMNGQINQNDEEEMGMTYEDLS